MPFIGLDLLAIRHLARQLDIQSTEVDSAANELTRLIESTDWFGADSRRFLEQWHAAQVPQLKRSAGLLKQASQLATRGATKQEDASKG